MTGEIISYMKCVFLSNVRYKTVISQTHARNFKYVRGEFHLLDNEIKDCVFICAPCPFVRKNEQNNWS